MKSALHTEVIAEVSDEESARHPEILSDVGSMSDEGVQIVPVSLSLGKNYKKTTSFGSGSIHFG